jgi:hypothetical protein
MLVVFPYGMLERFCSDVARLTLLLNVVIRCGYFECRSLAQAMIWQCWLGHQRILRLC